MTVFVGCAVIIALWGRYHFTTVQVNNDPTSTTDLAAATETARPLLDALEKYHAENGLYPTTLDELTAAQIPSLRGGVTCIPPAATGSISQTPAWRGRNTSMAG
jgi:hypothetical protein